MDPICQRCKLRPSTGVLVHLCDACFDQWESEVNADPTSVDIGPVDGRIKRECVGGDVPDDADAVAIVDNDQAVMVVMVLNGDQRARFD